MRFFSIPLPTSLLLVASAAAVGAAGASGCAHIRPETAQHYYFGHPTLNEVPSTPRVARPTEFPEPLYHLDGTPYEIDTEEALANAELPTVDSPALPVAQPALPVAQPAMPATEHLSQHSAVAPSLPAAPEVAATPSIAATDGPASSVLVHEPTSDEWDAPDRAMPPDVAGDEVLDRLLAGSSQGGLDDGTEPADPEMAEQGAMPNDSGEVQPEEPVDIEVAAHTPEFAAETGLPSVVPDSAHKSTVPASPGSPSTQIEQTWGAVLAPSTAPPRSAEEESPAAGYVRPTETSPLGVAVAAAAEALVGEQSENTVEGFLGALLAEHSVPAPPLAKDLWLRELYVSLKDQGLTYDQETPLPGDLVFFHNTFDRNQDGRNNDWYTHAGVVLRVRDDGTVVFVTLAQGEVQEMVMNLERAEVRRDEGRGITLNSFLRAKTMKDPEFTHYLTGELFAGFASLSPP